ncbi:MAG: hypothetical protein OET90_09590 [Desulfuromonadales bacterium]|nr:hypothetical protein [Desulfuromonadales bacterium]
MSRFKLLLAVTLLTLVVACTPSKPVEPPKVEPPKVQVGELPCAVTEPGPPAAIRYPLDSLYRAGAVLPTPEGLACLEHLSDWLYQNPGSGWQLTVGAEEVAGLIPEALASKRQQLLTRFFQRRGLSLEQWQWQEAVVGAESQLALEAITETP